MNGSEANCCLPGDITITEIHTGFMLGRALQQIGPGPWWEYVAIYVQFEDARREAIKLAREVGTRAWLHVSRDRYIRIPLDGVSEASL
jgi:hypothetical protein